MNNFLRSKDFVNLILFGLLGMAACKKSTGSGTSGTTVYVAGAVGTDAVYWKNGVLVKLTRPNETGRAVAIAVSGSDVYVAGTTNTTNGSLITYWKNGVETILPVTQAYGQATSIAVSGTDVYVTGYAQNNTYTTDDFPIPVYWKNGVADTLDIPGGHAQTMGIALSGGDIYVAGNFFDGSSTTSMYWKNGVMTSVATQNAVVNSIAVSGSDVYLAGDAPDNNGSFLGACWKNAASLPFTSGSYSHANAIVVSGTDVYVAGDSHIASGPQSFFADYWKDGDMITVNYGIGNGIAVSGSDVYVAGNSYDAGGNLLPAYWKNRVVTILPGKGSANAIVVTAAQ